MTDPKKALPVVLLVTLVAVIVYLRWGGEDAGGVEAGPDVPAADPGETGTVADPLAEAPWPPPWSQPAGPLPTYESTGLDLHGDALPDGALQRLGTHRMRQGAVISFLLFREGPDGTTLWTGASDRAFYEWDMDDGALLQEIEVEPGAWRRAGMDARGRLVAGTADGAITVWDLATGAQVKRHAELGVGLGLSPDGERVAVSSPEFGTVQIFGVDDRSPGASFQGRWKIGLSTWSPDGSLVASLATNRQKVLHRGGTEEEAMAMVYVWDPETGETLATVLSQDERIGAPVFSPDGALLWYGDEAGRVYACDARTGAPVHGFGEGEGGPAYALDVSPDGEMLAIGQGDGTLRILRAADGSTLREVTIGRIGVHAVRFAPDGRSVAAATGVTVQMVSVDSGVIEPRFQRHLSPVSAVAWSPDGKVVVTGSYDRQVHLWDAGTGEHLMHLEGSLAFVFSVCFSPDGSLVAAAGQDGAVRLWDAESGEQRPEALQLEMATTDIDFSPDGSTLAVASADKVVRLVDMETGVVTGEVAGLTGVTPFVRFLADGSRFVTAANDLRVFDTATLAELQRIEGFQGMVTSLDVSPDGGVVAAGLANRSVYLWGVGDGVTLHTLMGHGGRVAATAYAADGQRLATTSSLNSGPLLWDPRDGRRVGELPGHRSDVISLAFDPDGARLVTGSQDGTALIWSTPR